jgi:RNA polymerase sporulation-specific sigma factor
MPIILLEARKLSYGNRFALDDLVQEGVMALIGAMSSYDPDRGSEEGYVRVCARNRMISYLRRNGHELPMEDSALGVRVDSDAGSYSKERQELLEIREALEVLLESLSPFESEVLSAYLSGGGVSRAADTLKCERKKVDNALQRIRNKARALHAV